MSTDSNMKKIRQISIIILILLSTDTFSQTIFIENALQKTNVAKSNSEKLQAYIILFEQHESINKDSLFQYTLRAKKLTNKDDKINNGFVNIAFINALFRFDLIDTALTIIENELPKYDINNANERPIFFKLSKLKSDCYASVSNYKDASSIIYNTILLAEKHKDTATLAINYNALGEIAYNSDLVDDAFQWYFKALTITNNQTKYDAQIAVSSINLAMCYEWIGKSDSAKYYINKAISICTKIQNLYYLCNAYMGLSSNYRHAKNFKEAEYYMLQAMKIRKKTEGKIVFSNEQLALGNLYYRSNQFDKAITVFKDGLAYDDSINSDIISSKKKASNIIIRLYYYQGLARCYKATNQHDLYEQMLEEMIVTKDTLNQINAADAMANIQVKYETQKKENTIIQQKLDLTKKNLLLFGSIGLLLALTIIFIILFWSYKSRQELKLQQQIEEDKWLTHHEVAKAEEKERSRIAADLHDNLGVYAASIASNLNHIKIDENKENVQAFNELRNNSQAIVSQLNDTIWVLKKDTILLTAVGDRIKLLINRTQNSFPEIEINVTEDIENDIAFTASHAYHLYRILQEAINNALKHSNCNRIDIKITSIENWNISISDNGSGIENTTTKQATSGNGLTNMQARCAEVGWNIVWLPNEPNGTNVIISPTTN